MKDHHDVILRPVVSEKSYTQMEDGTYTFVVAPKASKTEIKAAVEAIFGVTVTKVNTQNRKGKTVRNRRSRQTSKRSDVKRAFVTLAEGDSIELFTS